LRKYVRIQDKFELENGFQGPFRKFTMVFGILWKNSLSHFTHRKPFGSVFSTGKPDNLICPKMVLINA